MTSQILCPFCASEKVFTLLGMQHCKRCKNMWHDDKKTRDSGELSGMGLPVRNPPASPRNRTVPQRARLEKELDDCIRRYGGRFSPDRMIWNSSITREMFRGYIQICVRNRTLEGKKDRNGTTWYRRPG